MSKRRKRLIRAGTTIIPALPGWYVAELVVGDDHLRLEAIIAWAIERYERDDDSISGDDPDRDLFRFIDHNVTPITADHFITSREHLVIKSPDGKFNIDGDTSCDNEADAIAELKERCAEDIGQQPRPIA